MQRRQGFTLVELLVVVAIIVVLLAVLLPSIGWARRYANLIKCASNQRSIGQGIAQIIQDGPPGI